MSGGKVHELEERWINVKVNSLEGLVAKLRMNNLCGMLIKADNELSGGKGD